MQGEVGNRVRTADFTTSPADANRRFRKLPPQVTNMEPLHEEPSTVRERVLAVFRRDGIRLPREALADDLPQENIDCGLENDYRDGLLYLTAAVRVAWSEFEEENTQFYMIQTPSRFIRNWRESLAADGLLPPLESAFVHLLRRFDGASPTFDALFRVADAFDAAQPTARIDWLLEAMIEYVVRPNDPFFNSVFSAWIAPHYSDQHALTLLDVLARLRPTANSSAVYRHPPVRAAAFSPSVWEPALAACAPLLTTRYTADAPKSIHAAFFS